MKKSNRKLSLHRDTLRTLSVSALQGAAGGILTPACVISQQCHVTLGCVTVVCITAGCPTGFDCTNLC